MKTSRRPARITRPQFCIEELEPRLLFSADPLVAAIAGMPGVVQVPHPVENTSSVPLRQPEAEHQSTRQAPAVTAAETKPTEIAFVDMSIDGAQDLIDALYRQQAEGRQIEVVTISAGQDGLNIISQTLASRQNIGAVHVFSHGDGQGLQLGTARLDATSMNAQLKDIAAWANALHEDADLLLYGCNLASTGDGRLLIDNLALLTGADVAASDDLTGSAARGGDWTLEYVTGRLDTQLAMSASLLGDWDHVLVTTTFQDGVSGYTGTTDTFLDQLSGSNNGASTTLSAGRATTQNGFQTLIKFENIIGADAGQIPQGAIVTNVTLTMYMTASPTFTNPTFSLYRMLASWSDNATWSSMGDGIGFGEARSSADRTITDSGVKSYTFASNAAMIASVQAWVNDPASNQGWYLFCDDNSSKASFASSENGTVANRPKLTVEYVIPSPVGMDLDPDNSSGATGNNYQGSFTEGAGAVKVAGTDATLTAGSTGTLAGMTITLNNRPNGASEVLSATVTGSISASYNSATGVLTLTGSGTLAQYQQVLRSVSYNNTSLNPDTTDRSLTVVVTDSYGTTATATSTLSVAAVNNAPAVTTTGSALTYTENAGAVVVDSGVTVADADNAALTGATVQISGNYVNGQDVLNFVNQNGITGTWDTATGTLTLSGTATVGQYQSALRSITYTNNSEAPSTSARTVRFVVSDGNLASAAATRSITVTAVNDAPMATITPASYSATEQTTLALQGTGLSISDVDVGSAVMQATLSVTSGVLTVAAGSSGVTVSNSGTATVTLSGTLAQLNALLAGSGAATITYLQSSDTPPASATLTLTASDLGNSGNGGVRTGSDTATINITAVNDAPTATITPTSYNASEQTNLSLHGTGLSVGDADAGTSSVQATLSVTAGALTVATGTTGVAVSGSGTGTVLLTGTLTQINNLLAGLNNGTITYVMNSDAPPASATLTLLVSDLGNSGSGGTLTASDTATINITAINDAPTATITPTTYNATEQISLTLHGTGLSIGDADAASASVQATLSVSAGTLTVVAGSTGVSVSGSGSGSVTLTGSLSQINSLLAGLNSGTITYVMSSDAPPASATLTLLVSDLGNSGSGGTLTASDTATINIAAVNDGPTATITPTTYNATEQVNLTLHGTGLSISDADAGSSSVQATLSVTAGVLNVAAGTTGVTVSGSGTGTVTLTGTLTQINNLLAGLNSGTLRYVINSNTPPASATLTLTASDLGNSGTGGILTASDTATINIAAVNDAPTATITPASYNATEQVLLALQGTGLSVADVDAASSTVSVTVSVVSGTLNAAAGSTGVIVAGSGSTSITLTGTLSQINNLLAGNGGATLGFIHSSDTPPGSTVLTLTINDLGNTGTGGARSGSDTATINIAAVNDAPTVLTNLGTSVSQGLQVVINNSRLRATDADHTASQLTYTITANTVHGVLTRNGVALGQGDTFTQADVDSGLIAYTHDNSVTVSDQFEFTVSDPLGSATTNRVFGITVNSANSAPTLSTNLPATVLEGQDVVITSSLLNTQDAEEADSELVYTLASLPAHGELRLNGLALGSGDSFTQQDINDGLLSYQHDGGETAGDGFTFTVEDGRGGVISTTAFVLNVTPLNDTPTATVSDGSVAEGGSLIIGNGLLQAGDADNPVTALTLTLQGEPSHGVLTLRGVVLEVGDTFTQADIDAGDLLYQHAGGEEAADQWLLSVSDGSASSGNIALDIVITPVNDAPLAVIALPGYAVQEQQMLDLHGTGMSVSDSESGNAAVHVTLSVVHGVLSVVTGGSGVGVTGSGTNTLQLTGTVNQVNSLLAGLNGATLRYQVTTDTPPAGDVLTLLIDDQGHTGAGGALSASDTATISITAVNDAPVATIALPSYSTTEQVPLALHGTGLSVSDADAGSSTVRVTVSVTHGVLTAGAGSTGTSVTGSGSGTVTFNGTLAQINALLAGSGGASLSYLSSTDTPPGSTVLTLSIDDLGQAGAGGALTGIDTAVINIAAVNDAPTATITSPAYTTTEQQALALHGTGMSVTDPDASGMPVAVTLSVVSGQLTVSSGGTGVAVSGSGTASVSLTGTIAQINALLAGINGATVSYLSATDTPPVSDTLTLTINDQGHGGPGGALTASDSALITITGINDAPVATMPPSYSATEQTPLALHGTGMAITDADAGSSTVQATLSATFGTLSAQAGSTGVLVTGSGTGSITLTGSVAQINALLAGNGGATISYLISGDIPPGSDTLALSVNDLGNTGAGGPQSSTAAALINIAPVNDAPGATITAPSYTASEQVPLVLHGTGLSIGDVDAGNGLVRATLSVLSGRLLAGPGSTGVAVSGSGTGSVTLTGTVAQINALLAGNGSASLTYRMDSDTPPATDTLTLIIDDQGHGGSGGALTASDSALITITALNDAPVATIPPSYSATEQTPLALHGTGLVITDADAGSSPVQASLSVAFGTLTAQAGSTGVLVTGSGTGSITLTGTITQINALLAGNGSATISYLIGGDAPPGSDTLALSVNDLANTGAGGALGHTATGLIQIISVNDAPVTTITQPSYAATEQVPLTLHGTGLAVSDADAGSTPVQAVISVISGALTFNAGNTGVTVAGSGGSVVVLQGTVAQINLLLAGQAGASAMYVIDSDNPPPTDSLTLAISDLGGNGTGGARFSQTSVDIDITPVYDAPRAGDDGFTTLANTSLPMTPGMLTGNDVSPEGRSFTLAIVQGPLHGTLLLRADGGVVYQPTAGYTGPDYFRYVIDDGIATSNVATVTIAVQAPVIGPIVPGPTSPGDSGGSSGNTPPSTGSGQTGASPGSGSNTTDPENSGGSGGSEGVEEGASPEGPVGGGTADDESTNEGGSLGGQLSGVGHTGRPSIGGRGLLAYAPPSSYAVTQAIVDLQVGLINVTLTSSIEGNSLTTVQLSLSDTARLLSSNLTLFGKEAPGDQVPLVRMTAAELQTVGSMLSIGAVWWSARGATLLTSLLMTTPMWRTMDPLPVLSTRVDEEEADRSGFGEDGEAERLFDEAPSPDASDLEIG